MSTNQPIRKLRYGNVQAAVWRNTDQEGRHFYTVKLDRTYKGQNGTWKSTTSFRRDDMLLLAKITADAFTVIDELQAADREARKEAANSSGEAA